MTSFTFLLLTLALRASAQSLTGFGVSGGNGSRGGIGDGAHPVLEAQAFITDALIPTAPNTTRQLTPGPPPVLLPSYIDSIPTSPEPREVIIDSANGARQEMMGFGHAWTDSAVITFNSLEPIVLDQVMQDLFGQDGNNMGIMRHTIGSSDLSYDQYSYDDNGPSFNEGEPDLELANFGLREHGNAMAAMIARMGSYKGDVFLFGSPWSYPGWTKYNSLFIAPDLNVNGGGSYNILNNSFNARFIPQMVNYFSKYVDAFKQHGVTVNGLTPENEPLNYEGGYPCMYLDAVDEANLIAQGLGDAMHDRGVKIMAYDHNTDQPVYPARVRQGADGGMDAAAWHCYQSPVANYSVMDDFHTMYPDVPQFMTECSNYLPQAGTVNWAVATSFIPPVNHGASGANMWVMATNPTYGPHSPYGGCAGCQGSIFVNSSTTYTKTNDYYMIGQFSRYVRRGAINYSIISGSEGSALDATQLYIMSVKNPDGSWAVIFMNNFGSDQNIRLSFTGSANVWQGTVPNSTVTTWLIPSDGVLNSTYPTCATPLPSMAGAPYGNVTSAAFSINLTATYSASSSSSSSSSSTALLPVPDTTHSIPSSAYTSATSS